MRSHVHFSFYAINPKFFTPSSCHLYACVPFTHEAPGLAPDDIEVLVFGDVRAQKSLMKPGTDDYLKPSMHN